MRANIARITETLGLGDLTISDVNMLIQLGEQAKSMKDIVTNMAVANSTPTRIIDRLVSNGLAERRSDPEDRRRVIVALTDMGIAIYRKVSEKRNEQIRRAFRNLSEDEKLVFIRLTNIVTQNMENDG